MRNCKIFEIPHKNQVNFSLISKVRNTKCVKEHIFNLTIFVSNRFVTDVVNSEHNACNHQKKIMHFSVKNTHNSLHFPTNGHPWDRLVSDLHKQL